MLGVVRILAHLVNKPADNMMNRLDLQFAGARENLVLAHQWCGMANLGHRAFGVIAHLPLEHAYTTANLRYRVPRSRISGSVTQRIHNLVKHALAGFDVQLLRGRIRRRMCFGVGKPVAHEFLFPMQRFDLQLLESLRIGIADALLQSSDALGVLVDYHQNRTAILWRDASGQFLHRGA